MATLFIMHSYMNTVNTEAQWSSYKLLVDADNKISIQECGVLIPKFSRRSVLMEIAKECNMRIVHQDTDKFGRQLIKFLRKEDVVKDIKDVMEDIIPMLEYESNESNDSASSFSYNQQRVMINRIFETTGGDSYNKASAMLRLVVIDSLYSTNAQYSYFSIEEMAEKIIDLGSETDAARYFYGLVCGEQDDTRGLFSKNYGIRKNLSEGSRQMSLMSKYAYYALLQDTTSYPLGFPIYDSLAVEMYPKVCDYLCVEKYPLKKQSNNEGEESLSIKEYITALNALRKGIFSGNELFDGKYQQYDILDAYLWRMGKLDGGNYSLLFDKDDYSQFIANLGLKEIDNEQLIESYAHFLKKDKDGKSIADFNAVVRALCANNEMNQVLCNIQDKDSIAAMIEHWKKYYVL